MREDLYDVVDNYIENEINYIQRKENCASLGKSEIADLYMLEKMTDEDIYKIVDSLMTNYELEETINNMIHEIIYG